MADAYKCISAARPIPSHPPCRTPLAGQHLWPFVCHIICTNCNLEK